MKGWCVMAYPHATSPMVFERFWTRRGARRCIRSLSRSPSTHFMSDGHGALIEGYKIERIRR
jgi:hypothetical protein